MKFRKTKLYLVIHAPFICQGILTYIKREFDGVTNRIKWLKVKVTAPSSVSFVLYPNKHCSGPFFFLNRIRYDWFNVPREVRRIPDVRFGRTESYTMLLWQEWAPLHFALQFGQGTLNRKFSREQIATGGPVTCPPFLPYFTQLDLFLG
jgi:hypothetical protein